jgi:large subunit ribosomal protein L24
MGALRIKKGDQVAVTAGKEKGKSGKVLRTMPDDRRVIVEGLNFIKRATKPSQQNPQGGFVTKEGSMHVSNVMVICQSCDRPSRVGHRVTDEGNKIRFCRRCKTDIDKG